MSGHYLIYYTESMIICIVIFGFLLGHDLYKGNRQERQIKYDNVLIAHILYFITDGFWAAVLAGALPRSMWLVLLLNYLNFLLISYIAYTWFTYAAASEGLEWRNTMRGRFFISLPMVFMSGVMLVLFITMPRFWVSEVGNLNSLYFPLFLLAPLFYVTSSAIYSLRAAMKKENRLRRRLYIFIGIYPMTVVVAGIIQSIVMIVPLFCYSCAVLMLVFYVLAQDDQISIDPLTQLNNRGHLIRYTSQENSLYREDLRSFVVMMDVNDFKTINDTYGHAEGDRALVMVAEVLKRAAGIPDTPPFLCRYGGDEFLMIAYCRDEEELNRLLEEIYLLLRRSCQEKQTPFRLEISAGVDELSRGEDVQACTERADQKLYEVKKQAKVGR